MKIETETLNQIRSELAHMIVLYGHDAGELMYQREQLVIEWFEKRIKAGKGIEILCPHCKFEITVYHLEWTAIMCPKCHKQINQAKAFDYRINYPDAS